MSDVKRFLAPMGTLIEGDQNPLFDNERVVLASDYDALAARLAEVCDAMTSLRHAITSYVGDIPERNSIGRAYAKLSIAIVRATQGASENRNADQPTPAPCTRCHVPHWISKPCPTWQVPIDREGDDCELCGYCKVHHTP